MNEVVAVSLVSDQYKELLESDRHTNRFWDAHVFYWISMHRSTEGFLCVVSSFGSK